VPLLHPWEGSGAAGATEFHAPERWRRRSAVAPGAFAAWPERRSPGWRSLRAARWTADPGCASGRIPVLQLVTGSPVLDAAGRRRSPATMPCFHAGRPPRNKGVRYPADPPTVEEIVAVMRIAGDGVHGRRLRGLVVVLWRAGLRIDEALSLREADLDRRRGSLLVRRGKGGATSRGRDGPLGMAGARALARRTRRAADRSAVLHHSTDAPAGRPWTTSGARAELRHAAARAGVRRRFPTSCGTHTPSRWPAKACR
jgi:integrase